MKFVDLAKKALRTVGAYGQGMPLNANDVSVAFDLANEMLDAWAAKRITIFQTLRVTTPVVANQGSPSNPYTVGIGGDIDIQRPLFISDANLSVNTTDPPFEIPLTILKDGEYAAIAIKAMSSAMATALYFNGKFDTTGADTGLGDLFLYPVPNGSYSMDLVLYVPTALREFADVDTTDYTFPPGYAQALHYQLALRCAGDFQRPLSPETMTLIRDTWKIVADSNAMSPNIRSDYGVPSVGSAYGLYNWRTGSNSRRGMT